MAGLSAVRGGFVEPTAEPGSFSVTYSYVPGELQLSWQSVPDAVGYTIYAGASMAALQPVGEPDTPGFVLKGQLPPQLFFQVLARFSSRASIAAEYINGGGGGGGFAGIGRALASAGVYLLIDSSHFLLIDEPGDRLRIS